MSVRPSAWNNSALTERILIKFDILEFSWKSIEKIQVSLKSDKNNGTLHEDVLHLWRYLPEVFLEWEMFQIKVVEKIETRILYSVTFFRKSYCL